MKKYLLLLASAVLILAACAKDIPGEVGTDSKEVKASFSIVSKAQPVSKALADNDGNGANVDRCTVEIYINDHGTFKYYKTPSLQKGNGAEWSFTETFLKNQHYKIMVWADNSEGYYVYEPQTAKVTKDLSKKVNNLDKLDAFYAVYPFQATDAALSEKQIITAVRPFAQVNVITTDVDERFQPKKVSVSYTAPTGIDLLNGEELINEAEVKSVDVEPYYAPGSAGPKWTLAMDYIFAPADRILKNIKFDVTMTEKIDYSFDNIPVQRNYRTNIFGALLTGEGQFNVIINPVWTSASAGEIDVTVWNGGTEEPDPEPAEKILNIESAAELAGWAAEINAGANYSGYTINMMNNFDMGAANWTPVNAFGKLEGATINGNGHSISNLKIRDCVNPGSTNYYAGFIGQSTGSLTIKDIEFTGADVEVEHGSGIAVVLGLTYGNTTFSNVTVKDSRVKSETKTGAILGFTGGDGCTVSIQNCKITDNTVTANYSYALLAGLLNTNDSINMDGNQIDGCTLAFDGNTDGWSDFAVINGVKYGNGGSKYFPVDYQGLSCLAEKRTGSAVVGGKTTNGEIFYFDGLVQEDESNFAIQTKEGFRAMVAIANSSDFFAGKTISLLADIDLENEEWTPARFWFPENKPTFDGCGYTIKNLKMTGSETNDLSLFGNSTLDIKNLTVDGATITGAKGYTGVVAGHLYGNVENVSVTNAEITASYWGIGGIVGFHNAGNMKNCSVTNTTINGGCPGGLVGVFNETSSSRIYENCSADNVTLNDVKMWGAPYLYGSIIAVVNADGLTLKGCSSSNMTYIYGAEQFTSGQEGSSEHAPVHALYGSNGESGEITVIVE